MPEDSVPRAIAMVSADYHPDVVGGAEIQCQKLSVALVQRGLEVVVLTSSRNPRAAPTVVDGVRIVRFRTGASPQLGGRQLGSSVLWGVQVIAWVWRNRRRIAVLHAHQAKMNAMWAVVAGSLAGIPVIAKVGTAEPSFDLTCLVRKRYLYGRLAAFLVKRRTIRIVAISDAIKADLIRAGVPVDRIRRLPNGVDTSALRPVTSQERLMERERLGIDPDRAVLVFTGRLSDQKNLFMLVDVVGDLMRAGSDPLLVLVGGGDLRAELEAQVSAGGLAAHVRFAGEVTDVGEHLRAADAFVLPSLAEGMSNSLLEAMSLGLPPLASRVGGNEEIIKDGVNGALFDNDPGDMRRVLVAFLQSSPAERERMGCEALRTVRRSYDIAAVALRYEQLYDEVSCVRMGWKLRKGAPYAIE